MILGEIARRLGIPLSRCSRRVRYRGDFYGQNESGWSLPEFISTDALINFFPKLRPGWTEMGCHPGLDRDLDSMYLREREIEVKTLCHSRVRKAITRMGIALRSYHDLRNDRNTHRNTQPDRCDTPERVAAG